MRADLIQWLLTFVGLFRSNLARSRVVIAAGSVAALVGLLVLARPGSTSDPGVLSILLLFVTLVLPLAIATLVATAAIKAAHGMRRLTAAQVAAQFGPLNHLHNLDLLVILRGYRALNGFVRRHQMDDLLQRASHRATAGLPGGPASSPDSGGVSPSGEAGEKPWWDGGSKPAAASHG